jgi:RsiW-degrading membrane proteinase PrsW (M82 family)
VNPDDVRCRACGWPIARPIGASATGMPRDFGRMPDPQLVGVAVVPVMAQGNGGGSGSTPAPGPASPGGSAWPAAPPPGYPAYPQGGYTPYPPYAYPPAPGGQPATPYPYYSYMPVPPRPQRPVYPLVVSWIVTVTGGISLLLGLLVLGLFSLFFAVSGVPDSLTSLGALTIYTLPPILGGAVAIVSGIFGILRRPSPRFTLPSALLFLVLALVSMGAAVVLWNRSTAPGPAILVLPLVVVSVSAPAFAVWAFTAWRLRDPSTRRHAWVSFFYGTTLAALVAGLLNTLFALIVVLVLQRLGFSLGSSAADPTSANPTDPAALVAIILIVGVVAPFVEEGMKPLGAVLVMRRLRSPSDAFLVGMASGIGFAIVETVGDYVGQGQADWISVAIERSTSSLLHGVGAGMGALGWYYFINGKGVRLRWLRGIGSLAYAVLQHGIFNGVVATIIPLLLIQVFPQPFTTVLGPPIDYNIIPLFAYDALILAWLIFITGRLRRSTTVTPGAVTPSAAAIPAPSAPPGVSGPELQPVAGGVR